MTDHHLTELTARMQKDARRCYRVYVDCRKNWEKHGSDPWDRNDVVVWQARASIAAKQAREMMEIVTR